MGLLIALGTPGPGSIQVLRGMRIFRSYLNSRLNLGEGLLKLKAKRPVLRQMTAGVVGPLFCSRSDNGATGGS